MDKLGIEPSLLLAQIVNFLIIMVVLNKLLYKPILTMLEKRKKKIEESLALTESLKAEEEKLAAKSEKVLEQARKQGQELIEEARAQGKEEEKRIIAEAKKNAEEIIQKAKNEGERMKKDMENHMKDEAIELAVSMSKRLLTGVMTNEVQQKVIHAHIKDLKNLKA